MRDLLPIFLFCCMVGITLFSFAYPWRLEGRLPRLLMHAPLLMIPCFIAYEAVIPVEMEVRFDLVVVTILLIASFFGYCVKLFAMQRPAKTNIMPRPRTIDEPLVAQRAGAPR